MVKVGTRVLTQPDGTLNHKRIEQLAEEIHALQAAGRRAVLVSSGAVGAGVGLLGLVRYLPKFGWQPIPATVIA